MIEYVVDSNPDDRVLAKAIKAMQNGEVICFPTDTNWVLGADPRSKKGSDRLYEIKNVDKVKHFSLLCNNISQASVYADITDQAFRMINRKVPGAYTFIFTPTREVPRLIKDYRKGSEIGIRIPKSMLVKKLIEQNGSPIMSTSISPEMLNVDIPYEQGITLLSYQIDEKIGHLVSIIIDPGEIEFKGDSSVIDFSKDNGVPNVLRVGAGDVKDFL